MTGIFRAATSWGGYHPQHPSEVIDMTMREYDCRNGLVAQMLPCERQRRGSALATSQRIHDDPPAFALDQRHVGDIEAAQLIDPVGNLEQAYLSIEDGVTPEARIDRRRCLPFHELEGIEVDQNLAIRVANLSFGPRDQTTPGVLEVLLIVEIEFLCKFFICLQCRRHGIAAGALDLNLVIATGERQKGRERCVIGLFHHCRSQDLNDFIRSSGSDRRLSRRS